MPQGQATSRKKAERIITEYQLSGLTCRQFCMAGNSTASAGHSDWQRQQRHSSGIGNCRCVPVHILFPIIGRASRLNNIRVIVSIFEESVYELLGG